MGPRLEKILTTKAEIETVITWTSADEKATVFSMHRRVWRMCERAGGQEIRKDEGIRAGRKVARTYLVDIDLIRIGRRRKLALSEEARAQRRERLRRGRGRPLSPESSSTESREKRPIPMKPSHVHGRRP
jgi:hypothetical protein